ncbi:MAG: hypothetical protein ACOC0A_03365 [Planctomycetota bacterium]
MTYDGQATENEWELLLGFIVILDDQGDGYRGGYLCTREDGSPVEFHYTEPVSPTRSQELLYGKTLRPQLLGKHIAGSLMEGTKERPDAIITENMHVLAGFEGDEIPVFCLCSEENEIPEGPNCKEVRNGSGSVVICWKSKGGEPEVLEEIKGIDIQEPLERARSVLKEMGEGAFVEEG